MNTAKMPAEIRATGWTQKEIADHIGVSQSTVSRWEKGLDPEGPNRDKLRELYEQVVQGGTASAAGKADLKSISLDELDGVASAVAFANGKVEFKRRLPGSTPETIAAAGLGMGKLEGVVATVHSKGITSGHAVAAEWVIPSSFLRHGLGSHPDSTIIVPVIGHSMEPRLLEGDRVIVDLAQNTWMADAMYAISFDSEENFQVKTIKVDRKAKPRVFRIISEATPGDEDRLGEDEFRIVGRVVGRISRP